MEASSLVLMEKEDGMLTNELGSYQIERGLEFVYKAYVEDGIVNLFLTTDRDVDDNEYNEIFDNYNMKYIADKGYDIEEVEDEFNPVWCIKFEYTEEYQPMEDTLNEIISFHEGEIKRIYNEIKK
ncbi:DUF6762 family protein [Fonticella tunisiensis]|uniref:Uncharacterized protein n=1 Tax=Fonticella tunisiensis TaxID=1096341 RepID=A0A4R7KS59_9CLOT|nr:DUF6762 family protein [Fonticella tunisiensis]TDT60922.1 hypothetical protein EDD71_11039 [Fonticella tunisiensis]